ncbi:MAG: hypothetical protein JW862_19160 [Anaerolineales bacterium]|nr:hypothetical protein [Anaerolineales bacterium]
MEVLRTEESSPQGLHVLSRGFIPSDHRQRAAAAVETAAQSMEVLRTEESSPQGLHALSRGFIPSGPGETHLRLSRCWFE